MPKLRKLSRRQRRHAKRIHKLEDKVKNLTNDITELQDSNTNILSWGKHNTEVSYGNIPLSEGAAGGCDPITCPDGCCFKAYLPGTKSKPWELKGNRNMSDMNKAVLLFCHGAATGIDNYADLLLDLQEKMWDAGTALAIIGPNTLLNGFSLLDDDIYANACIASVNAFKKHRGTEWGTWDLSKANWMIGGHSAGGGAALMLCCDNGQDSNAIGKYKELQLAVDPVVQQYWIKSMIVFDCTLGSGNESDLNKLNGTTFMSERVAIYNSVKNCASSIPVPRQIKLPSIVAWKLSNGDVNVPDNFRIFNVNLNYKKNLGLKSSYKWAWHCGWEGNSLRPLANACELLATILPFLTCPSYEGNGNCVYNPNSSGCVLPPAFQESGKSWGLGDLFKFSLDPKYQISVTLESLPLFCSYALTNDEQFFVDFVKSISERSAATPLLNNNGWDVLPIERVETPYWTSAFFGLIPERFHFSTTSSIFFKPSSA